ncbi:MAG: hypothetical protein HC778_09005 [Chamaesiphon sp. CSU_1_12]|nr:hypothetical protein [Chamaesiphon sp. CSU_1_12]
MLLRWQTSPHTENSAFSFNIPTATFADIDGDSLSYTTIVVDDAGNAQATPSWLTISNGSLSLAGTPLAGDVGSLNLKVTATDPSNVTVSNTFKLSVNPLNLTGNLTTTNRLTGTASNNILTGGNLVDILSGGDGNDMLFGLGGADKLNGDAGNDLLFGGGGKDVLIGGTGLDTFGFGDNQTATLTSLGVDTIADFTPTDDKIQLNKFTFSIFNTAGELTSDKFSIVTTDAAAATASGAIVYNSANGNLFYNTDLGLAGFGTNGGQFAKLTAGLAVDNTMFNIV